MLNGFEVVLTLLTTFAALGVLLYTIINREQLAPAKSQIPVYQLGEIEGGLLELRRVIVICDHVERPTDRLADAVESNFGRNVKYLFLVSDSRANEELNGYYRIFEALAMIQIARSPKPIAVQDLVEIRKLPYDWDDFPYIFYQYQVGLYDRLETIAFKGDQVRKGIANNYVSVNPQLAHTIARAVLADAPQPIQEEVMISREQFPSVPALTLVKTYQP